MTVNGRTRTVTLGDGALALIIALVGVLGVAVELHNMHRPPTLPAAFAYVITVLGAALLLARRRAAVPVAVGITVLCVAYHLLAYPGLAVAAPIFVAGYTVVADGRSRWSLLLGAVLVALVAGLPVIPPYPTPFLWTAAAGVAITMGVTLAIADATRSRHIADVEQSRRMAQKARTDADQRLVAQRLAIARELHDVLAHTITVIGVQAAAGLDALDRAPADTRSALHTIRSASKEAMAELRSTVRVLRDGAPADPVAPQPRLDQLPQVIDSARAAGLHLTLDTAGEPRAVPVAVELAAYRIVQEALTNVIRHAHADSATVRVEYRPDELLVQITDDGKGGSNGQTNGQTNGHGMIGMRERARAVGGTFEAGPVTAPGRGFVVRARLPLGGTR